MRDAQTHFDHAKALDPNNDLTQAFLDKVCKQKTTNFFDFIYDF